MNRLLHRLMVSLHADEISPARYINAVMVSHDLQIRTVSFKNMGRFLLIPDEYFFYPFRNHFPFMNPVTSKTASLPCRPDNLRGSPG